MSLTATTLTVVLVALLLGNTLAAQALSPLPQGDQGIAAKYPEDQDIARDPAVLWHDDFESGPPVGRWDNVFQRQLVTVNADPANIHRGKGSLQMLVPKQDKELSNGVSKKFEPGHDVLFLRYYSKFDTSFDAIGSSHNGSYIAAMSPGMPPSSPGVKADGRNKFEACFENWRGDEKTASPGELNVYCYHPEQRTMYGDHFFPTGIVNPYTYKPFDFGPQFIPRPNIIQELGRWYCYEFMVQANTPGKRDGRIACWLDGKLVADFPNLRLRDVDTLKINSALVGFHIKNNPRTETRKWYDDVVVATSYIGPVAKR